MKIGSRTFATWQVTAVVVGIVAGVVIGVFAVKAIRSINEPAPLTTPDAVAEAFMTAYASGKTTTACNLTSGTALQEMTDAGLCANDQDWSATHWQLAAPCHLGSPGTTVYWYGTSSPVRGETNALVILGGAGDSWRVTGVSHVDHNLCETFHR